MNAFIVQLKRNEIPIKERGINPANSYKHVKLTGEKGTAEVSMYTDGSKTEHHVGAGMVAVKNSRKIHTETQRLNIECTEFQSELCGIGMAVD
jgi:hypothetical protein